MLFYCKYAALVAILWFMRKCWPIFLFLYSLLLLKLIVFKYPPEAVFDPAGASIIPFDTISSYLLGEPTWSVAINNLLGNIVILMPWGFVLAGIYREWKIKEILAAGLAVGATLEFLQILFRSGIFDIDDIMLNALGVLMGYLVFVFIKNFFVVKKTVL